MEESIQTIRTENADSIEIGTAGKGGAVKIYGDFSKPEDFKAKITNAAEVRKFAQANIQMLA
jgi:hypothetical protein